MIRVAALAVAVSSLWLGLPGAALAQPREKGFAEFKVGAGDFDSTPPVEGEEDGIAGVSHITLGGWLNPRWRLGFDLGGMGLETSRLAPVWYAGVVAYYPQTTSGLHVTGGLGWTSVLLDIVDEFGETDTADLGTGLNLMAGAGWDLHLGRRFWLTPALNVRYGWPGDLVLAGRTSVPSWRYRTVDFTVGIRFD